MKTYIQKAWPRVKNFSQQELQLRATDAQRPAKRELGFAGLGQALRAHLETQIGLTR